MVEPRRLLDQDDYRLSMRVSPRAKDAGDNEDLRTVVVNRLTPTSKSVARMALRRNRVSMYCEPCEKWFSLNGLEFPVSWTCPRCATEFEMEFAVYEAMDDDEEDDE